VIREELTRKQEIADANGKAVVVADTYFNNLIKELSKKKISDEVLTDKNIEMINGKLLYGK